MTRLDRLVAVAGFLILLALHCDFWREPSAGAWLGVLPDELAWRMTWMLLAWGYLVFVAHRVWRDRGAEA